MFIWKVWVQNIYKKQRMEILNGWEIQPEICGQWSMSKYIYNAVTEIGLFINRS